MTAARPSAVRRLTSIGAMIAVVGMGAILLATLASHPASFGLGFLGLILVAFAVLRILATRGGRRALYVGVAGIGAALVVGGVVLAGEAVLLPLAGLLILGGTYAVLARAALRVRYGPVASAGAKSAPARATLIMNLKSGGGKAERFRLEDEARARGIEPVVLRPGDDLEQLARDAVAGGAEALGMAGGDGSQALVASVAVEHDLPFVCIPAGTRNHFAMDLGLDRDDPRAALAAFTEGVERRIDHGLVNGRFFVNNVSLGLYAKIVHEPGYREAKAATAFEVLPDVLGANTPPFDLRVQAPDGTRLEFMQMLLVSNNAYVLTAGDAFGYRTRLDAGELGIVVMGVEEAATIPNVVRLMLSDPTAPVRGFHQWSTSELEVASGDGIVLAGIDGEAVELEPPLLFETRPGALRVLVPPGTPERVAPPEIALGSVTFKRLWNVAHGRAPDA